MSRSSTPHYSWLCAILLLCLMSSFSLSLPSASKTAFADGKKHLDQAAFESCAEQGVLLRYVGSLATGIINSRRIFQYGQAGILQQGIEATEKAKTLQAELTQAQAKIDKAVAELVEAGKTGNITPELEASFKNSIQAAQTAATDFGKVSGESEIIPKVINVLRKAPWFIKSLRVLGISAGALFLFRLVQDFYCIFQQVSATSCNPATSPSDGTLCLDMSKLADESVCTQEDIASDNLLCKDPAALVAESPLFADYLARSDSSDLFFDGSQEALLTDPGSEELTI